MALTFTLTVVQEQIRGLAIALGVPAQGLDPRELEAALARKLSESGPFLWVVDDVPSGLDADTLRRWCAPASPGKTLVTTRTREYGAVGIPVSLGMLDPAEAVALLTARRTPQGPAEEAAARGLAEDLGFHPLGLEVAGAALKAQEGLCTFAEFRADLANPNADELEFAADPQIVEMLPTGHEPSVAATLLRSIRALGPEGRDVLRLASVLAVAPIPTRLVAQALGIDISDEPQARRRVGLALAQVDRASLATRVEDDAVAVHTLVSRTVRFSDDDPERTRGLRLAVVSGLNAILPAVMDVRKYADVALEVLHARELFRSEIKDGETSTLASWVARHDFERGALKAAHSLQDQVLAASRRVLGDEHPATLTAMNNLARSLFVLKLDLTEARVLLEQALAACRRLLGEEHPDTLTAKQDLARLLSWQGEATEARTLAEQVLATRRRMLGDEHPDTSPPEKGSAASTSRQARASPSIPLRKSTASTPTRIRI